MDHPIRINVSGFDLLLEGPLEYESEAIKERVFRVTCYGRFGSGQFAISQRGLMALADLTYRQAGQQPRDVVQVVRVELVAAAPPAPPVDQHEQTEPLDEVGQIRKRMLEGR